MCQRVDWCIRLRWGRTAVRPYAKFRWEIAARPLRPRLTFGGGEENKKS